MKPADGKEGILITDMTGQVYFRVYNEKKDFIDYKLVHSDLNIIIKDSDAYFYNEGSENPILDHSPETLGIKK